MTSEELDARWPLRGGKASLPRWSIAGLEASGRCIAAWEYVDEWGVSVLSFRRWRFHARDCDD